MANSSNTFVSRGTRVFHGVANSTGYTCRFVSRAATTGKLLLCPTAVRPCGVASFGFVDTDVVDYHRGGICTVETDGSAAVGEYVKADAGSTGKAIKDSSPGYTTAGQLLTLDTVTNIGEVELWF